MMKTEYIENGGFLQRDSVEHEEYAEAYSTENQEIKEKDGTGLLEKVLDRNNLNKAYKRIKANKGASGVDGMTIDEARNARMEGVSKRKHTERLLGCCR